MVEWGQEPELREADVPEPRAGGGAVIVPGQTV